MIGVINYVRSLLLSFTSVVGSSKATRTKMISKHILLNLNELRHRDKLCDLQLLSEDGEAFNLHKCVFIAACKRQFDIACSKENEMHTSKMCKMILPQVSSNELKAMISFIYGENTQDTLSPDLLLALSKLHMLDLLENTDQNTARLRIKEEPEVSVIVDVQVANDQEQQSPVKEPLLRTLLSEPEDFQIHTSTSGVAPDDFDGNNSDFELITLRQDRDRESTAVLKSIVSTVQDAYNGESSDKELLSLKQECEELAKNDPTTIEVKTEEDEHIEKLMDKISNELDLLKTPDQIPNSPSIANEINVGRNNGAEKVKTNLFPREAQTVDLDSTADSLLASDLVTQTFSSHSTIPPKAISPVRNLTAPSTNIIPIMISPMKEVKSKTISSSKYKMILPRVSNPEDIQVLSDLLSPNTASNKISQGTNMTKLLQKTSSNSQADITRKEELSCNSQENIQHRTIATLLALPPVMPRASVDEKKIESSKNNNEQVQRTVINEKKIKSSKNSNVEMARTIVEKKKIESRINSNVETHMNKNTESVDDSLNESPISSLCTEDTMERCDCDMSEGVVTGKNLKDAPKVIETKQGDMENSGSLISHPKFDQLHQKKNAVRRIYAMRLGYKHRNRPPLKMCNLDCKHIRKKNLDFGVGQNRENNPSPTKNRAVFLQGRKPASDPANSSPSDIQSGFHRSRQGNIYIYYRN